MLGLQHPLSLFQAALPPLLSAMLPSAATTSPTSPSADGDPPSALPAGADPPSEKKRNKQNTRSVSDTLQWCIGEGCGEKLCADFKWLLNKTPQQQHLTIFEDLEKTCSCARGAPTNQPTMGVWPFLGCGLNWGCHLPLKPTFAVPAVHFIAHIVILHPLGVCSP